MKINLAKSAGFCFGVKRALDIALEISGKGQKAYMLGDIVHNEDVIKKIKAAGIKKISVLKKAKNALLLIRAHGAGSSTINKARRLGYKIVDATCPMVKEIHKIASNMERAGYKIIIIGDKKHDEVHGIIGQLKAKAIVIDGLNNIPKKITQIKKAAIVSQSTQDADRVLKIAGILKQQIKDLKFFNTVCRPTRIKQEEIKLLPRNNDVVIVIGSRSSANTRRLYEISKSLNPRTFWIENKTQIKKDWFKGVNCAGITAGASTPDATTQEVINYIRRLK